VGGRQHAQLQAAGWVARGEDLTALLARSAAGDAVAFATLYDLTCPRVFLLVLLLVRDRDEATALTKGAYLTIWRTAHTYQPSSGSALRWMAGIADSHASSCTARARPAGWMT